MKVWETPFKRLCLPSVQVLTTVDDDQLYIRVWLKDYGCSQYYLVEFENLAAIKIEDESLIGHSPKNCEELRYKFGFICSFEDTDSDWISEYDKKLVENDYIKLRHFILTGGDNFIQALAYGFKVNGPYEYNEQA